MDDRKYTEHFTLSMLYSCQYHLISISIFEIEPSYHDKSMTSSYGTYLPKWLT